MFYHNINPILLKLGPFEIRYYGIFFLLGFIIAYYLLKQLVREEYLRIKEDEIENLLLYELIGVIVGARIVYVLVYNLGFYLNAPLQIFAIWNGGLSFHGGLIGSIIAGFVFSKKKGIGFFEIADALAIPASLGLVFGRIANFINGELVGRITNLPLGVKFPGYEGFRHPSQLYESLKNLIIFITLWSVRKKSMPKGTIFSLFILMYSVMRFFIEFYREPDSQLGFIIFSLTMGQILNVVMFSLGLVIMIYINRHK